MMKKLTIILLAIAFLSACGKEESLTLEQQAEDREIDGEIMGAKVIDKGIIRAVDKEEKDIYFIRVQRGIMNPLDLNVRSEDTLEIFKVGNIYDISYNKSKFVEYVKVIKQQEEE
jgi:hypothetical protein